MPTLAEIAESVGPKSVTVGAQTTEARTVDELIKAADYEKAQEAAENAGLGFRFVQFVPGGAG